MHWKQFSSNLWIPSSDVKKSFHSIFGTIWSLSYNIFSRFFPFVSKKYTYIDHICVLNISYWVAELQQKTKIEFLRKLSVYFKKNSFQNFFFFFEFFCCGVIFFFYFSYLFLSQFFLFFFELWIHTHTHWYNIQKKKVISSYKHQESMPKDFIIQSLKFMSNVLTCKAYQGKQRVFFIIIVHFYVCFFFLFRFVVAVFIIFYF